MAADPRTILVVEDNQDVKNVAVSLLEQLGYNTIAVESASEALDVLASGQTVNLIFTDVALPGQPAGVAAGAAEVEALHRGGIAAEVRRRPVAAELRRHIGADMVAAPDHVDAM